jgi:triosephosphate isomerase (TIM)
MQRRIPITKVPTKKKKLILAMNWKMYPKTAKEAKELVSTVYQFAKKAPHISCVVFPPAVFLPIFSLRAQGVAFGIQNIHAEIVGSNTGEVSAAQAASVGATYALVGHAERRAQGETNEDVGKKVYTALTTGLTPLVCVGEHTRDKKGEYLEEIRTQITAAFLLVPIHLRTKVAIAYEPLYAIGAPQPPAVNEIHQSLLAIKKILLEDYGGSVARVVPLLYGGAVSGDNIRTLALSIPELAGFLVGRASVDIEKLKELVGGL